jgi:hypothetical protein
MANEIQVTAKLVVSKGYLVHTENPGIIQVTMSGTTATGGAQDIGTSGEAITITDVATAGYAYFRNTSTTEYVEIGTGTAGSFVAFAKLKAGECGVIRLGTNAPTARAQTSSVKLQFYILAD